MYSYALQKRIELRNNREMGIHGYEHLTNRVPNNIFFRWLIKKANIHMKKCNSRWGFKIRYRKPKKGCRYYRGGGLPRNKANKIALYIVQRR